MNDIKINDIEKNLLKKAKSGDISAFESLIEGYQKKVFNIVFRMLGNYDDANDVTQEVFIKVFRYLKNFKEQSLFSTWLYRIATNTCLDELRKNKNKNIIYIDQDIKLEDSDIKRQVVDDNPTPDIIYEKNETSKLVNEAINKLSSEHKAAVVLRDIQGFSYEEIAKILNCPVGTIKSRINRGRKSLRELLENKRELFKEDFVKTDNKGVQTQ